MGAAGRLDMHLLQLFMRWLGIHRPVLRTSTMDVGGAKTERILSSAAAWAPTSTCRAVGGSAATSTRAAG